MADSWCKSSFVSQTKEALEEIDLSVVMCLEVGRATKENKENGEEEPEEGPEDNEDGANDSGGLNSSNSNIEEEFD